MEPLKYQLSTRLCLGLGLIRQQGQAGLFLGM